MTESIFVKELPRRIAIPDSDILFLQFLGVGRPFYEPNELFDDSSNEHFFGRKQWQCVFKIQAQTLHKRQLNNWQVFLTTEQFQGRTKNKNSVSNKLTKKSFKIYFEKIINQITKWKSN